MMFGTNELGRLNEYATTTSGESVSVIECHKEMMIVLNELRTELLEAIQLVRHTTTT